MKVFKYKKLGDGSLDEKKKQMQHVFDILENNRLFCSSFDKLNDPMEGYFEAVAKNRSEFKEISLMVEEIVNHQSRYRVCSLSSDEKSHLMWAHYANGFRGVAVELDIRKKVNLIEEVEYSDGRNLADYDPTGNLEDLTRKVLLTKYKEWRYEKEVRIIKRQEDDGPCFFELSKPPSGVYFGVNIDPTEKMRIQSVCQNIGISTYDMNLDGYKINFKLNKDVSQENVLKLERRR